MNAEPKQNQKRIRMLRLTLLLAGVISLFLWLLSPGRILSGEGSTWEERAIRMESGDGPHYTHLALSFSGRTRLPGENVSPEGLFNQDGSGAKALSDRLSRDVSDLLKTEHAKWTDRCFYSCSTRIPVNFGRGASLPEDRLTKEPDITVSAQAMLSGGDFFLIHDWPICKGRVFSQDEEEPVTVLNKSLACALFGSVDIIGRKVYCFDTELTVVGVVDDSSENRKEEEYGYIPYPVAEQAVKQEIPYSFLEFLYPEEASGNVRSCLEQILTGGQEAPAKQDILRVERAGTLVCGFGVLLRGCSVSEENAALPFWAHYVLERSAGRAFGVLISCLWILLSRPISDAILFFTGLFRCMFFQTEKKHDMYDFSFQISGNVLSCKSEGAASRSGGKKRDTTDPKIMISGGNTMRFFICEHCRNIVEMVKDSGVNVVCCGQKMTELIPGTSDGAVEKHVPVATVDGNKVSVAVGSVDHPMLDVHFIEWIAIETSAGAQRKFLKPGEAPKAEFVLAEGESFVAAYAYCNLHGLWKS